MSTFSFFVRYHILFIDKTKIKPKCAQYWPDIGSESHGHMQVKSLGESRMVDSDNEIVHDIIVRDLEICNQTAGKYFSHLVLSEQEI